MLLAPMVSMRLECVHESKECKMDCQLTGGSTLPLLDVQWSRS